MSKAEEVKLHIKVVINKEKNKVLLAEAGSDFTDVLLSFLLLPLGTIVRVLKKHYGVDAPVIGSLNTLYNGVANLDSIHFKSEYSKQNLLIPTSCYERVLRRIRLNASGIQPTSSNSAESYDGVFTDNAASFIISDDLRVMPNVAGSLMNSLSALGVALTEMDGAETRDFTFGLNEVMALLKESLVNLNPLTALVFPGSQVNLATEGHILLHQIDQNTTSLNPKKMILKVMLQKSTNKLLFAQADYDFISFLFNLLIISLGEVEWFLGSNTGLKNMDNLHRSVADNSENMHLTKIGKKNLLNSCIERDHYTSSHNKFSPLNFAPSGNQCHVKEARMYMVSDDLTVSPLGITSCVSVLNELKISLSDVEELELQVGLEEGLSILKAALTSTTALTDGLIKHALKKQHHQQKDQQIGVDEVSLTSDSAVSDGSVNQNSKKRPKLEC